MDAAARKSFEIQTQVRHNAQDYQATLKDLQNWEKEMKEKEKNLQSENKAETNDLKSLPVRSHLAAKQQLDKQEQQQVQHGKREKEAGKIAGHANNAHDEKPESAPDPEAQKRKEANEIKDIGNRHVKFQQYDLALNEYTAAIEIWPNEAVFYTNRAFCYLKLERYEECIEDCDRAIALDKLAVKAYYRRMQANESLGNYMDALKDCTSALTIEPRNAETKKSLDRINERLRKNQKSKTGPNFTPESDTLIEIHPVDKPAYKRSNKPLRRVPIADVVGPKATKTFQNLEISDDDIDKLFNSNCGPFVEVKKTVTSTEKVQPVVVSLAEKATPVPDVIGDSKTLTEESNKATNSTTTLTETKEISKSVSVDSKTLVHENNKEQKPTPKVDRVDIMPTNKQRPLPPAPTTAAQFYTNWKELHDKQKYQYLSSIDLKLLCKVLGAGFDSDTLSDCLRIIHDFYLPNSDATTAATLLEISRNEEIAILSLFIPKEDKNALLEILDSLESKKMINQETLKTIKTNFNLH